MSWVFRNGLGARCALAVLGLGTGCDASFKVVPSGGTLMLEPAATELEVGASTSVAICGFDTDGFGADDGTRVWATTTGGSYDATTATK